MIPEASLILSTSLLSLTTALLAVHFIGSLCVRNSAMKGLVPALVALHCAICALVGAQQTTWQDDNKRITYTPSGRLVPKPSRTY